MPKYTSYGTTTAQYDSAVESIQAVRRLFPDILPVQLRFFVYDRGDPSTHAIIPQTTPQSLYEFLLENNSQQDIDRIRSVIQAREIVDSKNGNKKEAEKQHKLLKKRFTKDTIGRIKQRLT